MTSTTYQLQPLDSERIVPSHIDKVVSQTVEDLITELKAEEVDPETVCRTVTDKVKMALVTEGNIPRHRVAVQTFFTRDDGQPLFIASKCLWDASTDNYTSYTTRALKSKIVLTVVTFCVYKE
jgi:hypothetical protein